VTVLGGLDVLSIHHDKEASVRSSAHGVFTAIVTWVDVCASFIHAVPQSVLIRAGVAVLTMENDQQSIFSPEGVCTHVGAAGCD
jgi:hypothetical protein